MALILGSLAVIGAAIGIPFTPLGELFEFVRTPEAFLMILAGIISLYLVLVESVKRLFYKRHAHRLERTLK